MKLVMFFQQLQFVCIAAMVTADNGSSSSLIKHLVVLMMENHSYDHFLGQYMQVNPNTDGSNSTMCNSLEDGEGGLVCVTHDGPFHTDEPENFIPDVDQQIYNIPYGKMPSKNSKPTMGGFVNNYVKYRGGQRAREVMQGLNQTTLPVLYKLAEEFAISDRWFSSVPGSTFPNRNFLHAATSGGVVTNDIPKLGYPFKTTFEALDQLNVTYGIYSSSPLPGTMLYRYFRLPRQVLSASSGHHHLDQFYEDCKQGTLSSYVFIEPAMFGVDERLRNDQHPHSGAYYDIRRGEQFYKEIYEALRSSPQWQDLLFLLVWDEHGGFYDHVAPLTSVSNPDGLTDPTFDFTRLGIRVPAILISPRIPKGWVLPKSDVLEHASVPSTLHAMFGMPFLTQRDREALPFHGYANLSIPRTDCITTLPDPAWGMDLNPG